MLGVATAWAAVLVDACQAALAFSGLVWNEIRIEASFPERRFCFRALRFWCLFEDEGVSGLNARFVEYVGLPAPSCCLGFGVINEGGEIS